MRLQAVHMETTFVGCEFVKAIGERMPLHQLALVHAKDEQVASFESVLEVAFAHQDPRGLQADLLS